MNRGIAMSCNCSNPTTPPPPPPPPGQPPQFSPCANINCSCGCTCACPRPSYGPYGELGGTYKITESHMILNNSARAAHLLGGGCTIIPKAYVPSTSGLLTSNGPKIAGCEYGCNPATSSEGLDCLNYMFNRKRVG